MGDNEEVDGFILFIYKFFFFFFLVSLWGGLIQIRVLI
jgi:hypothetical protein